MLDFFHRLRQNFRDTRGVSLMITLGLTMMLIIMAASVTKLVLGFMQTTKQVEQANIAYSTAEGGIEMALYDMAAYKNGYETSQINDADHKVCGDSVDINQTSNFNDICDSSDEYRFVDFAETSLSDGVGFWRLFSRTLDSYPAMVFVNEYYIPNPYFAGDKDGELEIGEWGQLSKSIPISLSLLTDIDPSESDPNNRFSYISDTAETSITFCFDDFVNQGAGDEELITWTLSALDGDGQEFTLQGVIWESDFTNQDCNDDASTGSKEYGFDFDLTNTVVAFGVDGDPYAGEDINKNMPTNHDAPADTFNRVSGVEESDGFLFSTPKEFLTDLNDAMGEISADDQWHSAQFTINLIATLLETSRDPLTSKSNNLDFYLKSDEPWVDEYTYIISEGFAGNVKQTIETRFRRESAIPIFSYVIFQ
jgi:hypothetical protein